jgi:acetyl-CoA carboxylase biotin carboxyl carrier protein
LSEKSKPKKPGGPKTKSSGPMDLSLLDRIVKLMQANDLTMVDLRDGELRVTLQRGAAGNVVQTVAPQMGGTGATALPPQSPAVAQEEEKYREIKSPMVGTFYAASSPDAKPFVSVGSKISDETDVCVIEAMKVFNNVKAECSGTIARIMVNNGQVVEFGQVLFLVKP